MNATFDEVIASDTQEKIDIFEHTAEELRSSSLHIEKDFWVCWTLDAIFNHEVFADGPRMLFKGGTSLSKSYGLINRFSEDIDVTVFRTDIGHGVSIEELEALSNRKRRAELDAIKDECGTYIRGEFKGKLENLIAGSMERCGITRDAWRLEIDPADPDEQTLLFWYPVAVPGRNDGYVKPAVKIESGAKSALDPHLTTQVSPYISQILGADLDLNVTGITTADPRRTFWDKIVVAHGQRQWYERKKEVKGNDENRVTRHYYDLFCMMNSPVGREALDDIDLGSNVAAHARMFFNRPPYGLDLATPGSFTIMPAQGMIPVLESDYRKMSNMMFGEVPSFDSLMVSLEEIEATVNREMAPILAP